MFCNLVYARLASGCLDAADRKRLDAELYAPLRGWDTVNRDLMARIASAGEA